MRLREAQAADSPTSRSDRGLISEGLLRAHRAGGAPESPRSPSGLRAPCATVPTGSSTVGRKDPFLLSSVPQTRSWAPTEQDGHTGWTTLLLASPQACG